MKLRRVALVPVASMLVIAAACGNPNDQAVQPVEGAPPDSTATTVAPTATTAASTTIAAEPTTANVAESTTTLPGVPVDGQIAGTEAQVAGVPWDETFVLRTLPGDDQPIAASLPPLTTLVLSGSTRDLDEGTVSVPWVEVAADGSTGWIAEWSLVFLAAPQDVTASAMAAFAGLPTATTMLELGAKVMDEVAPLDPGSAGAALVRATEPGSGPTSQVVYDVFPGEAFGDDASRGARYMVVGRQVPAGDLPTTGFGSVTEYELVSVEMRSLCTRGVSEPDGVCV